MSFSALAVLCYVLVEVPRSVNCKLVTLEPDLQVFHFLIAEVETGPAFELARCLHLLSA